MKRLIHGAAWIAHLAWCLSAAAQGPHEVALIVNATSPDSLEIAHHYAHVRRVPSANIIYLDLPPDFGGIRGEITPEQFERLILHPVRKEIGERNIADHILAWVYSAGFPIRVLTSPPISLNGATFVRGQYPPGDAIHQAQFISPFFRGPDKPGDPGLPTATLQEFAIALRDQMPTPSVLLAYTANRGLTVEETLDSLRRAAAADGTQPREPFFFHISDDVRSTARRWQFEGALAELKQTGATTLLSSNPPTAQTALSGLMLGIANTTEPWGRLQPGSLVDNLTSFGAEFHHHDQVRLTHWLRHGASVASGTVTEPYAAWPKFAHARLFAHYARGCTALESYLQALRSPLQQLLVGDPLVRPWGRPIPLTLISMEDAKRPLRGDVSFLASTLVAGPGMNYLFLLDGRSLPAPGANPGIRFDSRNFDDGWHELSAIVYSPGPVRRQGHARLGFTVDNSGRFARLAANGTNLVFDYYRPFRVLVAASAGATGLTLTAHDRVIWSGPASTQEVAVILNPAVIGPGPVPLYAVAHYPDGGRARSAPLPISIQRLNRPPDTPAVSRRTNEAGRVVYLAAAADPEGDPVAIAWFQDRLSDPPSGMVVTSDGWTLAHTSGARIAQIPSLADTDPEEIVFRLATRHEARDTGPLVCGLAWDIRDDRNYSYFGWHWLWSAWVAGRVRDGAYEPLLARGMPRPPRGVEDLSVRRDGDAVSIRINGEEFLRDARIPLRGPIGVIGGPIAATLTALLNSEPAPEGILPAGRWWIRVADPHAATWSAVDFHRL